MADEPKRELLDLATWEEFSVMRCENCAGAECVPRCTLYRTRSLCRIELNCEHYRRLDELRKEKQPTDPDEIFVREVLISYCQHAMLLARMMRDLGFTGDNLQYAREANKTMEVKLQQLKKTMEVLEDRGLLQKRAPELPVDISIQDEIEAVRSSFEHLIALGIKPEQIIPMDHLQELLIVESETKLLESE